MSRTRTVHPILELSQGTPEVVNQLGEKRRENEKTLTIDIGRWYRPLDSRFEQNPDQINPNKSIFFANS